MFRKWKICRSPFSYFSYKKMIRKRKTDSPYHKLLNTSEESKKSSNFLSNLLEWSLISKTRKLSCGVWTLGGMICGCVIIIVAGVLYCSLAGGSQELNPPDVDVPPPPSHSFMGEYSNGAVVANSAPCAAIGNKILQKYGSAVDAAIATMICDGVGCLQNMGIGGGFFMTIYQKSSGKAFHLNARETAPAAAKEDMYDGDPEKSQKGGLSVAVPGELRGYEEAYKRFGGKAPWSELFKDTVALCRNGLMVDNHLANSLKGYEKDIKESATLRKVLLNKDGEVPKLGDNLKLLLLGDTLEKIGQSDGADIFYNGSLTKGLVEDIKESGGIITLEDMANYKVRWEKPVEISLSRGLKAYSSPPPGSGPVIGLILKTLDGIVPSGEGSLVDTQRITEAFKFAYAHRTQLGDPWYTNVSEVLNDENYIKSIKARIWDNVTHNDASWYGAKFLGTEDHGTANIAVVAPNGDAVVATSTVNLVFGSKVMSKSTGIILNDEMDDFSSPKSNNYFGLRPSEANLIKPGKRPLSSMCPTVVVDSNGQVRLAVGGAGGTKITSATALVAIYNLWYGKTIKEAIDEPRFHHQIYPMKWQYEYGITKSLVEGMVKIGHQTMRLKPALINSCVTAVGSSLNGGLNAYFDPRRPGSTDGGLFDNKFVTELIEISLEESSRDNLALNNLKNYIVSQKKNESEEMFLENKSKSIFNFVAALNSTSKINPQLPFHIGQKVLQSMFLSKVR